MTIQFTLTLAVEGGAAGSRSTTRAITAAIKRTSLTAETLGLTLAEGKAILAELQAAVVAEQVSAHESAARRCLACGTDRGIKGHHPLTCRTAFGTLPLTVTRLRRCRCGADPSAGDRASFSPLADLLPGRSTPELLYLETRWGALVSYGLAARMLGDVLPIDRPVSPERVRRHLHAVAACEEAAMGEEPDEATWVWSGCQRDLDEMLAPKMPPPDGPAYVGVDGGFVRDRAGLLVRGGRRQVGAWLSPQRPRGRSAAPGQVLRLCPSPRRPPAPAPAGRACISGLRAKPEARAYIGRRRRRAPARGAGRSRRPSTYRTGSISPCG